jgi:hypothetical protein
MSADSLGVKSLFGFCEGFTAKKFCRFCKCTREETDEKYNEADFTLRSLIRMIMQWCLSLMLHTITEQLE